MDQRLKEAQCGFISINQESHITEVNQTFLEWMEYEQNEILGKHFEYLLSTPNKMIYHSYFYPNIHLYQQVEELFIRIKSKSGNSIPYLMNAKQFEENGVKVIDCILVQMKKRIDYELELRATKSQLETAYAKKQEAFEKLEQLHLQIEIKQLELMEINSGLIVVTNTDKLTGISNRKFFQEKLEEQIDLFHRKGIIFSLCIIDIDHFKKVNDTYGHPVGDSVLVKLAKILQSSARPEDVVARFGGEEFTIIQPNLNEQDAIFFAEQLTQTVEHSVWEETGSLTISIGVATFSAGDTELSIVKHADQALYMSKHNGRNRATHFNRIYSY